MSDIDWFKASVWMAIIAFLGGFWALVALALRAVLR